ncbi:ParB N-terminal domain-containing protein [Sulfitobacter sp. S190]|uniref:ParB/RepB/Spo0J family partition protein n=1 Tax=Sulfitobacter sp. S190 TaxID=2867022 RepID=UPI0021A83B87|nr:ParB N-terminal domain-containing protein [Sulfitobacter sp. S190]UWR24374.1 ParB N-terminal domain-containing protein [Sulfitobacter sp. S190]
MSGKNKFGFGPIDDAPKQKSEPRIRTVGPMGAAVRETAQSLTEATEAKVEQRRKNADDAKAFRAAQDEGRVLVAVPLGEISTSDLPRDRLALDDVAASDEMEELKSSIRERGQKEPIEVYRDEAGALQLKKGWRRFTALSQLFAETGDPQFASVTARIETDGADRIERYVDMVEENVVRENLTFAEMAQVAITAAQDDSVEGGDAEAMVLRLYASLHKTKRSYVRAFVFLMQSLGEDLRWPKAVARNLGVEVSRLLRAGQGADALRAELRQATDEADQLRILKSFASAPPKPAAATKSPKAKASEKFEFRIGETKVTARKGECRIVGKRDYANVPKDQLAKAIEAFEAVLKGE